PRPQLRADLSRARSDLRHLPHAEGRAALRLRGSRRPGAFRQADDLSLPGHRRPVRLAGQAARRRSGGLRPGTAAAPATNARLERLPAAQRAAAHAATDAKLVAWAAGLAALLAVCWLVSASGLLGRIRRLVEARAPRPWLASAVCAAALALA